MYVLQQRKKCVIEKIKDYYYKRLISVTDKIAMNSQWKFELRKQ